MCAHAVRVAVEKIDGVEAVKVSLNEGMAEVRLGPENHVTLRQVREAILANGFTPKAADVRVTGRIVAQGAALALVVPGSAERYLLGAPRGAADTLAELRRHRGGAPVTLAGVVPAEDDEEESGDGAPLSLIVSSVEAGAR